MAILVIARNVNAAMVAPMVRYGTSAFSESLKSGFRRSVLCWCVSRNLASFPVKLFHIQFSLQRNFMNFVSDMQFSVIILQYIVLLFNTKKHTRVKFDGL